MEEKNIQNLLIEIICSTVNEEESNNSIKEKITPELLVEVYRLAKKHDLAHMVSDFVYKNKIEVAPELGARLQREEIMSVYRYEQMKFAFEEICESFERAEIPYIPLKGSVIRPYYPRENMRTSCDIDILIHEEALESAISILVAKGYECKERNYHDVSLHSPNNIHLELHFNIQENMDNLDAVLKDVWEYALPVSNSRYELSKEFFAFHIFAHMAYHFVSGGCGIRPLLDIWIMEHRMGVSYSQAKALLEKAGIYQFSAEMSKLAELCFTNNDRDPFYDSVLKYIFQGGVYGNKKNNIAVHKSKKKSSFSYLIKRLFLPYRYMNVAYPILKKAPYLLPFYWIFRWIKALFGGKSKLIVSEMTYANNMADDDIKEVADVWSRLEL